MAFLGNTFDPADVAPDERGSFEPMPAGDYDVQIIESDVVKTSKGGDMLKLTLEVISGPFENRKIWDNLNIRNDNPVAQNIAHQTLKAICDAVGVGPIQESDELHFKPLVATLKIEPARGEYEARNGVKRYKARGGAAPAGKAPAQRSAPATAAPAARGATGARPWTNRQSAAAARPDLDDNIPF